MRNALIAIVMLLCSLGTPAYAQISINFGGPGVSIGINLPVYPTLERIPGYPVYYAPGVNSNYFFYDGLYWVFNGDDWFASSWYNGPWYLVDRYDVPLYVLRVPVRYYRHAPEYFREWRRDAPPRWGDRWGGSWEQRRSGWDRWDRNAVPRPAPLPTYQRQYSGTRYPQVTQQQATIQFRQYRYQPQDPVAQHSYQQLRTQAQAAPSAPAAPRQQAAPQPPAPQQPAPQQPAAPRQQGEPQRQAQPPRPPREAPAPRVEQAPREQPAPAARVQQPAKEQPAARAPQAPREQPQRAEPAQPQNPAARAPQPAKEQPQRPEPPRAQPPQAREPQAPQPPRAQPQDKGQDRAADKGQDKGAEKGKGRDKDKDKEKD